jgi:RNA polymerase sigma-70 factor (family 1)
MRFQPSLINLTKLKEGDGPSFKCLFDQLYPELFLFANSIVINPPIAEEIVIDSFVKFWIKRSTFHCFSPIRSFLFITTKNSCFNYLDKVTTEARVKKEFQILHELNELTIQNEITRNEIILEVFRLVKDLPPQCQKIMIMGFSEGLNNEKIASLMGISKHTVKNQKVRGIKMLKKRIKGKTG